MIIALNNKSNLNKEEFTNYLNKLNNINTNNTLILCPTYLNISMFNSNNILLGSQNVSLYDNGAYTGEVSAKNLASYNVKYSIQLFLYCIKFVELLKIFYLVYLLIYISSYLDLPEF